MICLMTIVALRSLSSFPFYVSILDNALENAMFHLCLRKNIGSQDNIHRRLAESKMLRLVGKEAGFEVHRMGSKSQAMLIKKIFVKIKG
jgi:hypothetical protein